MALEGAVDVVTKIATTAVPVATEAIAQTAVQGVAEVGKTAIETSVETLSESAVKAAEAQASVLSEGIAKSAESAMTMGGADAALSSIGSAKIPGELSSSEDQIFSAGAATAEENTESPVASGSPAENLTQPIEVSSSMTDSGMDQRAIDAVNQRIAELKAQGKDPDFFERKAIYDEEAGKLSVLSETGDQAPVAQEEQAVTQTDAGITDEIKNDPGFQKKLVEEQTAARERGEPIDEKELSQRALDKFNQDKQVEQSQLTPEQQKIQQLENKIQALTEQNELLLEKINELGKFMQELGEWAKGHEQDPKKKESLIVLLAKIAAIIVLGSVIEGGKTAAPPLGSPTG